MVMSYVVVLLVRIHLAWCVYLTMTDIELTIPSDIRRLPAQDHPILTLFAKDSEKETNHHNEGLSFYGNGTEFVQVYRPGGDVLFTPSFFQRNIKELGSISATVSVENAITKDRDWTSLQVNVFPLDKLDCDEFLKEICYWTGVTYRIQEGMESTALGPLSSPYIKEMCPYYGLNYTTSSDKIKLIPPSSGQAFWLLGTSRPLYAGTTKAKVTCIIENKTGREKGSTREIKRDLRLVVIDVDNHPPVAQHKEIFINITERNYKKESSIHNSGLIFTDEDSVGVNTYEESVIGENGEDLLQPVCKKHPDTRDGKNKTAIHCKLIFKKDKQFTGSNYSFILELKDTTMKSAGSGNVAKFPVHLIFSSRAEALTEKPKYILYPDILPKIFRTAAPFARVVQPIQLRGSTNFSLVDLSESNIFNITKEEGIVFVKADQFYALEKSPEHVSLNISWIRDNKSEHDIIRIRIVDEPNETCKELTAFHNWTFCAKYATARECLRQNSCGIGTGGAYSYELRNVPNSSKRCMWRGDKISSNITHLYSTCTPDTKTCPDGKCDALEKLHTLICPQDCTKEVLWPTRLNSRTGRGIDEASGVVTCDKLDRCTSGKTLGNATNIGGLKPNKNKPTGKSKKQKNSTKTPTFDSPLQVQPNVSRQVGNFTAGKFLGVDIAKCGTICVLGIAGGTLFLGSAVALVVICWRLERVNKAVRDKNNEENHEMTAPLSVSIPRNISNEPIPFNFQMNTALHETMNIINKYAPDPKWEFPRSQLVIEQTLGEGEFGRVLRAKASNIAGQPGYTTVAVKTLKDDAREAELNDLLSEYQLLKEVSHPSVIRLLGVCTSPGGPVYLIIEYAEHGSLRNYLRRSRHLKSENRNSSSSHLEDNELDYDEPNLCKVTPKEILSFAWQICNGMAYLSDIKLVHRDLAARNVLLATDKICKISDFGLTRDVYEDNAYFKRSKGRVPVKWMAPESLADHIYTTKSDVWSFGILIWELVTLGATPYPGIAVQNLFHLLRQGYRMERPDNCSHGLYKIMKSCWHIDPEKRPSFQELAGCWEKLLEDKTEYTDLSNNAIINKEYFCSLDEKEENVEEDNPEDISPLNYLSRAQSYEKCGATDKILNDEVESIRQNDINLIINTQGYETPVKFPRKVKTPSNEDPQDYTDMGGRCK